VIAETDTDNIPSHKVLENNNFKIYDKTSERYFWKADNLNNKKKV
jgi:RimJ/RimL family protein N-acetyltransferase